MYSWKDYLLYTPLFIISVDILNYFSGGILSIIRALLLFLFFFIYLYSNVIYIDKIYKCFLIFFAYSFTVSMLNTSNILITISGNLSIFISSSYYIISYNIFNSYKDFKKFAFWIYTIPLLFIINFIIFTGFNIGHSVYGVESAIKAGDLHHSRLYAGSLVILLSFVLLKYSKNKFRDIFLLTSLLIILILSLRRTAIIIILSSLVIFIFSYKKIQALKLIIGFSLLLILTYPLYKNPLNNILEARGQRVIVDEETLEEESRFREIQAVSIMIFSFTDLNYSLFGTEYLNSFGTYSLPNMPFPDTRILHTDYAVLLHGTGIIGLLIYMCFLFLIVSKVFYFINNIGFRNELTIIMLMLLLTLIIVTISGSILNITFRTFYFIILGACFRFGDELIKRRLYINYE